MYAELRSRWVPVLLVAMCSAGALWMLHHALSVLSMEHRYAPVFAAMFAVLVWQNTLAFMEKRHAPFDAPGKIVAGLIPAYNEDSSALAACVISMINQTRKPDILVVIDDGSTEDYTETRWKLLRAAESAGVHLVWRAQVNGGKRKAQVRALHEADELSRRVYGRVVDYVWTADSDGISDSKVLASLLGPTRDADVSSVAGIVLAANVRKSFLTRFTDLWFVAGQLSDRSALSTLGSVWVNSGPIALLRASVMRENQWGYLNETFMGKEVAYSDDSLLTLYAMTEGRTVQQPTAFCFSLMPETVDNHYRQYSRWMKGSFIRSLWRMRYLSAKRSVFWLHLARWAQVVIASVMVVVIAAALGSTYMTVLSSPWNVDYATVGKALAWITSIPLLIGMGISARYLLVRRSDQSLPYQVGTWFTAPVAMVWALTVMRYIRWVSVVSVFMSSRSQSWGTRQRVEVRL